MCLVVGQCVDLEHDNDCIRTLCSHCERVISQTDDIHESFTGNPVRLGASAHLDSPPILRLESICARRKSCCMWNRLFITGLAQQIVSSRVRILRVLPPLDPHNLLVRSNSEHCYHPREIDA